ncbi:MAG: leucine efflux protein LeuE [Pseudomonadota bacterium]|jgi:threonine/homoserine/homoserine lactone efflux protein
MFGITDYGAFCAAVLLFLMLPGPGTFALLTATGQGGLRAGMSAACGIILGDQVLLWLAVAGVAALLAAYPGVFHAVQYAGAAYLGWIGLKLLRARDGAAPVVRMTPGRYLRQGLLITLLNPKAIVFYMAFFPLFIDPARHQGALTFGAMALTIATITLLYCLLLCRFADAIAARVRANRRLGRWLERLAGVFLIGFGIRLTTS